MRARYVAAPFPTVGLDTPAVEAARLLATKDQPMTGAITLDALLDRMLGA